MASNRNLLAIAWVPNIGGTVTDRDNLRNVLGGLTPCVSESDVQILFSYDGADVSVSIGGIHLFTIHPLDARGMCEIYGTLESGSLDRSLLSSHMRAMWDTFRKSIDGTSEISECSAMDRPMNPPEDGNIHDAIVMRFIYALENISDYGTHVPSDDPHEAALIELRSGTGVDSNILYFDRFVDMFGNELVGDIEDYRSQVSVGGRRTG